MQFTFYKNRTLYYIRYCGELSKKKGGSIDFEPGSLSTKQCTGYVPHKPSWYDVEHVGKLPDPEQRIAELTYKVHG